MAVAKNAAPSVGCTRTTWLVVLLLLLQSTAPPPAPVENARAPWMPQAVGTTTPLLQAGRSRPPAPLALPAKAPQPKRRARALAKPKAKLRRVAMLPAARRPWQLILPPGKPATAPHGAKPSEVMTDSSVGTAALASDAAIVPVTLDGVSAGDWPVQFDGEDVWVRSDDLQRQGVSANGRIRARDGLFWTSLKSLSAKLTFSMGQDVSLTIAHVHPAAQVFDMHGERPTLSVVERSFSAFVNYNATASNSATPRGFAELGLSYKNALAYSSAAYIDGQSIRQLSNVTFDRPSALQRIVFGDALATTGDVLGASAIVGGLQIARTFEVDPYFLHTPGLGQTGSTGTPATAEIYVNGQLVRRQEVLPGPFELRNLPAPAGAGDVRVVVRDLFGRTRDFSSAYYLPSGLLSKGMSEYSYSAGFMRKALGRRSFDYGDLAFFGRHRLGLSDTFTAQARAEGSTEFVSGGLTGVLATVGGQLELATGTSQSQGQFGAAASLGFARIGKMATSAYARTISDHYANASLLPTDDRTTFDGGLNVSAPVHKFNVGVQFQGSEYRDRGWEARTAALASFRPAPKLQLTVTASMTDSHAGRRSHEVFANLTTLLGKRTTGSVGAQDDNGRRSVELNAHGARPMGTGVGYDVQLQAGDRTRAALAGEAQNNVGQLRATYEWTGNRNLATASASGGVVYVGGSVFATKPVEQGFALVRVKGVEGVHTYLNNQDVGRTNRDGELIVTGLVPYYSNRLSIADIDVPVDRMLMLREREVSPSHRGGVVVDFPADRIRILKGRVIMNGADAAFGEMTVEHDGQTSTSPMGQRGEFEFSNVPPGHHTAHVQTNTGSCQFEINVPTSDAPADLGAVTCARSLQ